MSVKQCKRTAIYIAPSAYGEPVDLNETLSVCKSCVKKHKELKLMRIYRDEKVEIIGGAEKERQSKSPIGAEGNDAWKRLLTDVETSAVEAVVIYAARMVAPTITALSTMLNEFFIPCGIRFIDAEAEFDTADGDAESYIKAKTSEYRSTVGRKPYEKKQKQQQFRTRSSSKFRGVRADHRKNGIDRYTAYIRVAGKTKYLGTYATAEEAARAVDEETRKLYGCDGFYNFPRQGERDCHTGEIFMGEEDAVWAEETE